MRCPVCRNMIISTDGNKQKLRSRIIIFSHHKAMAKCQTCKTDVEVPIRFNRSYELTNNNILRAS
ncbi:MAG: hypothetical protein PHX78_08690 [bacterium]|nr:hypothetical protein [bacterium]